MMKKLLMIPGMALALSVVGCGSGSEVTVNPAPEMTREQIEQMDAESALARQQAIEEGS